MRVLVVEDERDRGVRPQGLTEHGYAVDVAHDRRGGRGTRSPRHTCNAGRSNGAEGRLGGQCLDTKCR